MRPEQQYIIDNILFDNNMHSIRKAMNGCNQSTIQDYHSGIGLSRSLATLVLKNPVANAIRLYQSSGSTKSMDMGTLIHSIILEGKIPSEAVLTSHWDRKTTEGRRGYAREIYKACGLAPDDLEEAGHNELSKMADAAITRFNKMVFSPEDSQIAKMTGFAVAESKWGETIRNSRSSGATETNIYKRYRGVLLKERCDCFYMDGDQAIDLNIKTTSLPINSVVSPGSIRKYGLHISAAIHDAIHEGRGHIKFLVVPIPKSSNASYGPERIGCFRLDDHWVDSGYRDLNIAIDILVEAASNNSLLDYPEDGILVRLSRGWTIWQTEDDFARDYYRGIQDSEHLPTIDELREAPSGQERMGIWQRIKSLLS